MLNFLGQFGPLVGTRLYPESEGPYYVKGMAVCGGFMFAVGGLAWVLRLILRKENERIVYEEKEERIEQEELIDGERTERRLLNIL